jgi:putative flippase GtrA
MSEFQRYLIAGGVNLGVSYGLYLALSLVLPYAIAYTSAYSVGLVVSYLLQARLVFRAPLRLGAALRYPLVYVAQYLAGVGLLTLLVDTLGVHTAVAPALVIAATVPLTFILSRLIVRGRAVQRGSEDTGCDTYEAEIP